MRESFRIYDTLGWVSQNRENGLLIPDLFARCRKPSIRFFQTFWIFKATRTHQRIRWRENGTILFILFF